MTSSVFDYLGFTLAQGAMDSMPFDEGMVLYIPRIYPERRGGSLDETKVTNKIEMECLEQDLGEVLRVDLQLKEPQPGDKFFQAFVHIRWHDTEENRRLQLEVSRANTRGPGGHKCPAPKLRVGGGGFWVLLPRSIEAAWRANGEQANSDGDEDPLAKPALRRSQAGGCAPTHALGRFGLEGVNPYPDPIEEYARAAGVEEPDELVVICTKAGVRLDALRSMAGEGTVLATTIAFAREGIDGVAGDVVARLVAHEKRIKSGEVRENVASETALRAGRALDEEVQRARETWSRQGLEGALPGHWW